MTACLSLLPSGREAFHPWPFIFLCQTEMWQRSSSCLLLQILSFLFTTPTRIEKWASFSSQRGERTGVWAGRSQVFLPAVTQMHAMHASHCPFSSSFLPLRRRATEIMRHALPGFPPPPPSHCMEEAQEFSASSQETGYRRGQPPRVLLPLPARPALYVEETESRMP